MRNVTRFIALAVAGALTVAAVALASTGSVRIGVVSKGAPVANVTVQVLTSDGITSLVTDARGFVIFDAGNRSFRVRVNGKTDARALTAADSPVVVTLN